jgi:hypothetical protein
MFLQRGSSQIEFHEPHKLLEDIFRFIGEQMGNIIDKIYLTLYKRKIWSRVI